jgi:small subunit ribosomal protein S3
MGQKVNPVGIRLKINRTWDSVWFAKKQNYGTYLIEDFKIRKYINSTIKNSGVSKIMIEKTFEKMCCHYLYITTGICNWKKRI